MRPSSCLFTYSCGRDGRVNATRFTSQTSIIPGTLLFAGLAMMSSTTPSIKRASHQRWMPDRVPPTDIAIRLWSWKRTLKCNTVSQQWWISCPCAGALSPCPPCARETWQGSQPWNLRFGSTTVDRSRRLHAWKTHATDDLFRLSLS
jgi:hypothetical protein